MSDTPGRGESSSTPFSIVKRLLAASGGPGASFERVTRTPAIPNMVRRRRAAGEYNPPGLETLFNAIVDRDTPITDIASKGVIHYDPAEQTADTLPHEAAHALWAAEKPKSVVARILELSPEATSAIRSHPTYRGINDEGIATEATSYSLGEPKGSVADAIINTAAGGMQPEAASKLRRLHEGLRALYEKYPAERRPIRWRKQPGDTDEMDERDLYGP